MQLDVNSKAAGGGGRTGVEGHGREFHPDKCSSLPVVL